MKHPLILAIVAALTFAALPASAAHLAPYHGSFELSGDQEVPRAESDFVGSCNAILDGVTLYLSCTNDITNTITAAHIHAGFVGEAGPVLIPLTAGRVMNEELTLTEEQRALVITGGTYVNVHTAENPPGEIRGQIVLRQVEGTQDLHAMGGGDLENPPVETDSSAACRFLYDTDDTPTLNVYCVHDVEDPVAAHIHGAAPGENGPIVFPFDDPANPLIQSFDLTADQLTTLQSGGFYVNVHTAENPGGEVRVNLVGCTADNNTLCLYRNRFAVTVAGTAPNNTGGVDPFVGAARPLSDASGNFSFFTPDNKEILVKVLNGCPITNAFWVFFAATTNVEFALTVTDTATGTTKTYANAQGTAAVPVQDTSAFATCP